MGCAFLLIGMTTPLVASVVTSTLDPGAVSAVTTLFLLVMWATACGAWACLAGGDSPVVQLRIRPSTRDAIIAVALGIGGLLLIPALSWLAAQLLGDTELLDSAERSPVWLIVAGVLTAAVTEEVLYRAAPMELLLRRRCPQWLAVAAPLAIFVACHLGSWNLSHVVGVVLPMGLLLSLVYLWRRSLIVNIVAHFLIDAPLIVIAVVGSS